MTFGEIVHMLEGMSMRTFDIAGRTFAVLGDPHIGKRWVADVPMNRRGDREAWQGETLVQHFRELDENKIHTHVNTGDTFHNVNVSAQDLLLVYTAYREAIENNPNISFVVLTGNHDISRNKEVVGSYDILQQMLTPLGVEFVRDQPTLIDQILYVPYNPHISTTEMTEPYHAQCFSAVFGHFDIVSPTSDHNIIPQLNTPLVITGHDHLRRTLMRGNTTIEVVGSMQPYAHGEDADEAIYRTVTLAELETISDTSMMYLRVMLGENEVLPENLDALQIQVRQIGVVENAPIEVYFEDFDMIKLWGGVMSEHGVSEKLSAELLEGYQNRGE